MFGMGFFEIFIVIIIAIIFLGPDKLPQAMIELAKFFKILKKTLDDAKSSIDKELNLEELKKEALNYKNTLTQGLDEIQYDTQIQSILEPSNPKNKSSQKIQNELNAQSLKEKELAQEAQSIAISDHSQQKQLKSKES